MSRVTRTGRPSTHSLANCFNSKTRCTNSPLLVLRERRRQLHSVRRPLALGHGDALRHCTALARTGTRPITHGRATKVGLVTLTAAADRNGAYLIGHAS